MIEYKAKNYKFLWQFLNKHARSLKPYVLGYKSYTALITQSGTNAPEVVVLDNTLCIDITYTRTGVGEYIGTINKVIFESPNEYTQITSAIHTFGTTASGDVMQVVPVWDNVILIESFESGTQQDGILGDGYPTVLEIRKYI